MPTGASEVIHACAANEDPQGTELFGVDAHHPCFLMVRVSSDDTGPVDFSRSIVRGDRYQIHLRLRTG